MQIIKIIILGCIVPLINTLPLSYTSHIFIFDSLFNTDIFTKKEILSILNLSLILATIYFFRTNIINILKVRKRNKSTLKGKEKRKQEKNRRLRRPTNKNFKKGIIAAIITTVIYILIPKKTFSLKITALLFILPSLLLLLSTNKRGTKSFKELSTKDFILLSFAPILTIFPTVSSLCAYLFMASILHLNKKTSFNLSLLLNLSSLLLSSILGITYLLNDTTYLLPILISLILSSILSFQLIKYLKKIYYENKLYKLSIYLLFLSIFLLIWFR